MLSSASSPRISKIRLLHGLHAGLAALIAAAMGMAAEPPPGEFGKDIQLAPFVVKGQRLSISVHARTNPDRRYATEFAEDVVGIAYETMQKSTGAGLVIVGREGEPHPIVVIRKFVALAAAGQLDPSMAAKTAELDAFMARWKTMMNLDENNKDDDDDEKGEQDFKITFDMIMPALPLPLEGVASKLYQLSWAEGFDDARVEKKLRSLTAADLAADELSKYDWVFYLPPRNAYVTVQDEIVKQGMKKEKMGFMMRAAVRSALVVFKPAIKKAVEGFRKGMLFMTVLRARSGYDKPGDIKYLTTAYTNVLMPDFKFNGGTERARALEAIEKAKLKNAEYWKDPFTAPPRLATFDPAAYAPFEGDYAVRIDKDGKPGKPRRSLIWTNGVYHWKADYNKKPRICYPAGERLLVAADGKMTVEFKVDEQGNVTAAEERWERNRHTIRRQAEVAPAAPAKKKRK